MEALGAQDVHRVGNVGLGVKEPDVAGGRAYHGVVKVNLSGEHGVDAIAGVGAQSGRKGAAAHVALHDEHVLAAGGKRLGEVGGDGGLALGGDGRRHHDGADGVVHGGKADVGCERLDGVLDEDAIVLCLLGHGLSPSLHGGNAADDGNAEELLEVLLAADLGIEHVGDDHDGHGGKEAGEKADGNVERALGAAGAGGHLGGVNDVDGVHAHDLAGHARDLLGHLVGDVGGALGVCAGDLEREDAGGGGAGDGGGVALEVLKAQGLCGLKHHAVRLEEGGHVVGDHLGGGEV